MFLLFVGCRWFLNFDSAPTSTRMNDVKMNAANKSLGVAETWVLLVITLTPWQGEHFQHRSHALVCAVHEPHAIWAISEARKMDLTRSLTALASPAGDTYLGSTTYADAYKTDTILQVKSDVNRKACFLRRTFAGLEGSTTFSLVTQPRSRPNVRSIRSPTQTIVRSFVRGGGERPIRHCGSWAVACPSVRPHAPFRW